MRTFSQNQGKLIKQQSFMDANPKANPKQKAKAVPKQKAAAKRKEAGEVENEGTKSRKKNK